MSIPRAMTSTTIMRITSSMVTPRMAYLLSACAAAGIGVALLPSPAIKLAMVVGIAGTVLAVLLARRGLVLDPAWVIVTQLYVFLPVRTVLLDTVEGFSTVSAVSLAFVPFVIGGLIVSREARASAVLLAPLVLLGLTAAASTAWSPAPDYGWEKVIIWAVNGFIPAAAMIVLYTAKGSISWRLILIGALAYAFAILIIGSPWAPGSDQVSLSGQNPIVASRAVLVGAIVAMFGPFPTWVRFAAPPVSILAGLATGSLGPAVALVSGAVAGVAGSLLLAHRSGRKTSLGWAGAIVALGLSAVVVVSGALDFILAPLIYDSNVTARSDYLAASAPLFLGAPFFGIGFGGFSDGGLALYPHNLPAEIAVETGIVGLVFFAAWMILALAGAFRTPVVLALAVATAVYTLFSGSLAGQPEFWLFSGLAVALAPLAWRREEWPNGRLSPQYLTPQSPRAELGEAGRRITQSTTGSLQPGTTGDRPG